MSPQNLRKTIGAEVSALINQESYQSVRDSLEALEIYLNAKLSDEFIMSPEEAQAKLEQIKQIQAKKFSGDFSSVEKLTTNIIQNDEQSLRNVYTAGKDVINAGGDVNQAQRDILNAKGNIYIIEQAAEGIKKESPNIPVSIILLVMTKQEAQELQDDIIYQEYNNPIYNQQFKDLLTTLEKDSVQDALDRYGKTSEDWKPFGINDITIGEFIDGKLKAIDGFQKTLVPNFVDLRLLTNDDTEEQARKDLVRLRNNGCLVVMDVISMYHPTIQRVYRRSLIDAYPKVSVARLAPSSNVLKIAQQMISFQEHFINFEFYKRFVWDEDTSCDQLYENVDFRRWLSSNAKRVVPEMEIKREQDNVRQTYKRTTGAV